MHIRDLLTSGKTTISFEFFPPRHADGETKLRETLEVLQSYAPDFVSITYGAGGTTRELTRDLVLQLQHSSTLHPIPHLTCIGHSTTEITEMLETYAEAGISNVLALRGDRPAGGLACEGDYAHASALVSAIRRFRGHPDPRGFGIGVAGFPEGHPGTPNRLLEMDYLKAKVDAGSDYICTQLFLDNHDFYDFRERCELAGITVPIIAGIMPVTNQTLLRRIAELAAGSRIPARLLKALDRAGGNPDALEQIGTQYAATQCADLFNQGVAGLHFYTLNQARPTVSILRSLGRQPATMPVEDLTRELVS